MKKLLTLLTGILLVSALSAQHANWWRYRTYLHGGVKIGNTVVNTGVNLPGSNLVEIDSVTSDGTNIYFYHGANILTAVPGVGGAAWGTITGTLNDQVDLKAALDLKANLDSPILTGAPTVPGYVPTSTTVNGHALTGNVTVTATDVSLGNVTNESKATMFADAVLTGAPTVPGYVPTSRTVNGHALTGNISVTATDVSLGNVTNESKATMFTNSILTGHPTIEGVTATGATGTGKLVFDTSPTLITPALGTPSAGTLTNCTFPTLNQNTTGSAATLTTARTIGGVSFNGSANITVASATGGFTVSGAVLETATLKATTGAAAGNMLISDADGDLSYLGAGATTEILVGGGAAVPVWTTATGTGAPVRGTSPTIGGTLSMDNGATIINTDADNLDITEDTVKVSGLIRAASAKIDDAIFFETAIGAIFYVADNSVGSNDTYTATYVGFTYTTGKVITFHPLTANIDGCTLNINGDGAVAIETQAAGALSTNDLLATGFYHLCWDGDNWVLMD